MNLLAAHLLVPFPDCVEPMIYRPPTKKIIFIFSIHYSPEQLIPEVVRSFAEFVLAFVFFPPPIACIRPVMKLAIQPIVFPSFLSR